MSLYVQRSDMQVGLGHFEVFVKHLVKDLIRSKGGLAAVVGSDDAPAHHDPLFVQDKHFHNLTNMIQHRKQYAAMEHLSSLPVTCQVAVVDIQIEVEHGGTGHGADSTPVKALDELIARIANKDLGLTPGFAQQSRDVAACRLALDLVVQLGGDFLRQLGQHIGSHGNTGLLRSILNDYRDGNCVADSLHVLVQSGSAGLQEEGGQQHQSVCTTILIELCPLGRHLGGMLGHGDNGSNAGFLTLFHNNMNHFFSLGVAELIVFTSNTEKGQTVAAMGSQIPTFVAQAVIVYLTSGGKGCGYDRTNTFQFQNSLLLHVSQVVQVAALVSLQDMVNKVADKAALDVGMALRLEVL